MIKKTISKFLKSSLWLLCTGALVATSQVAQAGSFAYTGSMATARSFDKGVMLGSGLVLIVGGDTNTAQLYNPTTGTFSSTGSMTYEHRRGTVTLLGTGKVLVAGGDDFDYVSGQWYSQPYTELYDPSAGTFSVVGSMTINRVNHSATLLQNGQVLIAGGWTGNLSCSTSLGSGPSCKAELFDPSTNTFTATGEMPAGFDLHTATLMPDGVVLVTGGRDNNLNALNHAYIYYTPGGYWYPVHDLQHDRFLHTATLLGNGKVLLTGGYNDDHDPINKAELYDPSTGTFSFTSNLLTVLGEQTATLLNNGYVLIAGGNTSSFHTDLSVSSSQTNTAELYNPSTGTFSSTGNLQSARANHTETLLGNGTVLITGGRNHSSGYLSSAEIFTP